MRIITKKRVAFMFGGQGSQYYHMGIELYRTNTVFRFWMNQLDGMVREISGLSVIAHVYDDHKDFTMMFDDITYTHPAIFMVQFSLARTLIEEGIEPDVLLGMSLGEYVSAAVADCAEVRTILESILLQSEMIRTVCERGGMIAVLSSPELFYTSSQLHHGCSLAAVNYDNHFVISGKEEDIAIAEEWLRDRHIIHQKLPVSYPFHSSYLESIKTDYVEHLQTIKYSTSIVTRMSCSVGDYCDNVTADDLWQSIRDPIRLNDAVQKLDIQQDYVYLDLSPSGTVGALVNHILIGKERTIFPMITRFNQDVSNVKRAVDYCSSEIVIDQFY